MSRGAVQPAVITLKKNQRTQPEPIRQTNAVQRAVITLLAKITITPRPVQ